MTVRYQVFPRSQKPGDFVERVADAFRVHEATIGTPPNKPKSDEVLRTIGPDLRKIGFIVESSKSAAGKVRVPILFGLNGTEIQAFEVDAWHPGFGAMVEVEAGIAFDARKFYQDLFEAIAMPSVRIAFIAVQNAYHPHRFKEGRDDFKKGVEVVDALLASGRLVLPMETLVVLGY